MKFLSDNFNKNLLDNINKKIIPMILLLNNFNKKFTINVSKINRLLVSLNKFPKLEIREVLKKLWLIIILKYSTINIYTTKIRNDKGKYVQE